MTVTQGAQALAAMDYDDFAAVVADAVPRRTPPAVWDALTDPAVIDRTRDCLIALRVDVQHQLGVANSEADEARAEAAGNSEEAREAFFAEKNAQAEWRRRTKGFLRLVDQRSALVKSRTPRPVHSPPGTKNARKHNADALEKLARAVALHRRRVLSGEGSEDDDETLWDCLSTVTAIARDEEFPLKKWLEFLDEAREDEE
jgi:hypothetical protein